MDKVIQDGGNLCLLKFQTIEMCIAAIKNKKFTYIKPNSLNLSFDMEYLHDLYNHSNTDKQLIEDMENELARSEKWFSKLMTLETKYKTGDQIDDINDRLLYVLDHDVSKLKLFL